VAAKKSFETRAEQEAAEYSTWRAVHPIPFGDQIAFQPGHIVPNSHVEQYKYDEQGLVERIRGEEKAVAAAINPATTAAE
jgi:hypothetical protein